MSGAFVNAGVVGAGISSEQYRTQTAKRGEPGYVMGRSDLVEFNACPHRWLKGREDDETTATEWGTLIDLLVLGGDASKIVVPPAIYPAEGRKGEVTEKPWNWNATFCKDWRDDHAGQMIVARSTYEQAQLAAGLLRDDPHVAALLDKAECQVMVAAGWRDEKTGVVVPVKVLIDVVPHAAGKCGACLADLKTARSCGHRAWQRAVFEHGYHVQAALYLDVFNAVERKDKRGLWLHPIQENEPPYEIGRRMLDGGYIDLGRAVYRRALERYAECLKSGTWPGYEDGENNPAIEGWSIAAPEPWMVMQAGVVVNADPTATW